MVDLTVSVVAGIIAAIVVLVQQTVPSFAAWLAIAIIEKDATAVTWTVTNRLVSLSHWPTLIRSDATASRHVHRGVVILNWSLPFLLIAIAISAIVAPLGLTDVVSQSNSWIQARAEYAVDRSLIGDTTPLRANNIYTRDCSFIWGNVCPGSQTNLTIFAPNSSYIQTNTSYQDNHISPHLRDVYESGLRSMAPTISGPFDIQARFYFDVSDPEVNQGELQRVPRYRRITSLIEDDSTKLVEGLIVDASNGGVGFRNHTIPANMAYGAAWKEDIFFVDSETTCVDLNLTLQYRAPSAQAAGLVSADDGGISLVDNGGFAGFKNRPKYPEANLTDPQANPDLWMRAYKTAYMVNAYTAAVWNITNLAVYSGPNQTGEVVRKSFEFVNSEKGRMHNLTKSDLGLNYESLEPQQLYEFLVPGTYSTKAGTPDNPWNVTDDDFSGLNVICSGGGQDLANISNLAVTCGMMIGPARLRTGEPLPLAYEPGVELSSSIYSCASVPRASIKEVTFHYTGKSGLAGLSVDTIRPKQYATEDQKPLWAAENAGITLGNANPLWGLTSQQYINEVNISTTRSERFYVPGLTGGLRQPFSGRGLFFNLPSIDFFVGAHKNFYAPSSFDENEYSGANSIAMYQRWQRLATNALTAAKIVDLAWTDMMGNALVGTKSWINNPAAPDAMMTIQPMRHRVGYRWRYGVLPFLTVLLCGCVALAAVISAIYARRGVRVIQRFLKQTSVGRLYTHQAYPERTNMDANTGAWIDRVGKVRIEPCSEGRSDIQQLSGSGSESPEEIAIEHQMK